MQPKALDAIAPNTPSMGDTLPNEVADALARGLITPAEVAGLSHEELAALEALCQQAQAVGDYPRAHRLTLALVVLAPYWASGWQLLAALLHKQKATAHAAYAERAASLLAPPPAAAPEQDEPAAPGPQAPKLEAPEPTVNTLVLRDGRPLPLRHTPAALHHDTVTARITAQALLGQNSHTRTARWAQGDGPPPDEDTPITKTSIVRIRGSRSPEGAPKEAEERSGVTSKIPRPPPSARAATRRLLGWPVTDPDSHLE